jgi:hypothetical protein
VKEILIALGVIVALLIVLCVGLSWLMTERGHFTITRHDGTVIHAVEIVNPGRGRIYYTLADGREGVIAGSFTVEETQMGPEAAK